MFLPMNFFTPKLMKLDGLLFSLGLLHITSYIKLSKHGSNLNSIFVIMNELKFFLLMGVLTQNFNTMDLVNYLKKIKKTTHLESQIVAVTLKVT
jgi:hypothetical protein